MRRWFALLSLVLLLLLGAPLSAPAATRLYLYLTTAAEVTPTVRGTWDDVTEGLHRKTGTVKESTAITVGQVVDSAVTGNHRDLDRVYVSAPLSGNQTIATTDTVRGVLMTREYAGTDNVDSVHFGFFVVSGDGGTLRCTLLATNDYVARAEFVNNATHRNKRMADGDAVSATCNALDGDRLQFEIGYRVASGGGTSPQASGKYGDNATDCAENETNTTNCAGWVELSATLVFAGPAIVLDVLTTISDDVDRTDFEYAFPSVTWNTNDLLLVMFCHSASGEPAQPGEISGGGLLFDFYAIEVFDSNTKKIWTYHAMGTGATGVIKIFGVGTYTGMLARLVRVTGVPTGANGANALGVNNVANNTDTNLTVNVGTLANAASVVLGSFCVTANEAITPQDGETELSEGGFASPPMTLQIQYKLNDATSHAGWTSSVPVAGLGVELLDAGGGGGGMGVGGLLLRGIGR